MRNLLSICDIKDEILEILNLANKFKHDIVKNKPLKGKSLAMIFQKSSTRTRISFEVGMYQLGGNSLFLSADDLHLSRGESISDTAKVLSRYVDGIMIRAVNHEDLIEFSKTSEVPIINGLTNMEHPCQALADILTFEEHRGHLNGKITYIGDGNNVCNSLLLICASLGMDMAVACPPGYEPDLTIVDNAKKIAADFGSEIIITPDIELAIENTDAIYTDVWISMGDEGQRMKRKIDLRKYQVNSQLMELTAENTMFMHCLPAVRGEEVTSDVIDGKNSVVIDQAENRLYAQKAILYHLLK